MIYIKIERVMGETGSNLKRSKKAIEVFHF